jgi:hypothetical protein
VGGLNNNDLRFSVSVEAVYVWLLYQENPRLALGAGDGRAFAAAVAQPAAVADGFWLAWPAAPLRARDVGGGVGVGDGAAQLPQRVAAMLRARFPSTNSAAAMLAQTQANLERVNALLADERQKRLDGTPVTMMVRLSAGGPLSLMMIDDQNRGWKLKNINVFTTAAESYFATINKVQGAAAHTHRSRFSVLATRTDRPCCSAQLLLAAARAARAWPIWPLPAPSPVRPSPTASPTRSLHVA